MTEKTARLGTTTLHIQHDHELEPDMLRIQLENDHGTESWTQTVERVARALKRESARADFDFRGEDQHVRLVIGTDGGFVEVEDPGGDITEHEFTAYELSRALYETGARDPLPHEVLVPELARVADALAGDGRRLLVGPLSQSSSKPCAGTLLIERDGKVESIPRESVVSIRLLSAQPVRNSAIRDLEHAAALAWPGVESTWIDGWLARAGAGFSRRANSAVPLDRSARADAPTLRALTSWYAERDLPVLLALPERLIAARTVGGEPASPTVHILTRTLDDFPGATDDFPGMTTGLGITGELDVELAPTPSARWAQSYSRGRDTDLVAAVVEDHEAGARGALVDCSDVLGHR